jgi:N-sulfoglucosamine sulfohydrolase
MPIYPWEVVDESPTRDVNWVAGRAESFFKTAKEDGRPFFLTVGYMDPHRDHTRGGFGNGDDQVSAEDPLYSAENVAVPGYLSDIPEVREELAEYYRSIGRVDRGLGLIMKHLKDNGFDSDTLVMFMSDNGPPFLNSKTTLYDAGIRLPFIVRQPGVTATELNPNFVSYIDILPTILDWAGYQPGTRKTDSPPRRGRSILPVMTKTSLDDGDGDDDTWTRVYGSHTFHEITNYYPTRFIRTPRYKYHRNIAWKLDFPFSTDLYASLSWEGMRNIDGPVKIGWRTLEAYIRRPAEELFDMRDDPREVNNVAQDPAYRDVLMHMRVEMEQWQRDTNDPWLVRDGVSLLEMQGHIDAGLKIPERFDFEVHAPRSK